MTKIDLQQIGFTDSTSTLINSNSDQIEIKSDIFLSRDGTSPNEMLADLDMNSHRIMNLPVPAGLTEPLRLGDLPNFGVGGSVTVPDLANVTITTKPLLNDGVALGTTTKSWSDLFLASGAVINWNNGNVLLTHSAGNLAFTGATSYNFSTFIAPTVNDGAALGAATVSWSDLFLANGAVINFNNGALTMTHSASGLQVSQSTPSGSVVLGLSNTSNTGGNSHTRFDIFTGGSNGGDVMINFGLTGETSWQIGAKNSDNSFRITNNGAVGFGTGDRVTIDGNGTFTTFNSQIATGNLIAEFRDGNRESVSVFANADGTIANAAVCVLKVREAGGTARSINAAGSINASGADYAEYEYKRSDCGVFEKGSVVGFDKDGLLTDKWSLATTFGVKSTRPGYVGGDDWEGPREFVDRIAYSGKVPVNVFGAQPGDYIEVTQATDDSIVGIVSTTQNSKTVGCVRCILSDGRALIKII